MRGEEKLKRENKGSKKRYCRENMIFFLNKNCLIEFFYFLFFTLIIKYLNNIFTLKLFLNPSIIQIYN